MIDEKKLLVELEKWLDDTTYLKEKYSGSVQFKDGTGENIMYTHAEIAYDVLSTVIDKINEQPIVGEWISASERLPEDMKTVLVWFEYFRYGNFNRPYRTYGLGYAYGGKWSQLINGQSGWKDLKILEWMPLPEPYMEESIMIDERKLIKILSKNSSFNKITNIEEETVFDIINEQPKVGEWISCSKKMPESEKRSRNHLYL